MANGVNRAWNATQVFGGMYLPRWTDNTARAMAAKQLIDSGEILMHAFSD